MSTSQITAAARPLTLYETVQVEGRDTVREINLDMSPLTDRDITELDLWVQVKFVRMARAAAQGLATEEYEKEIELAQRTAALLSAFTGQGARMLSTVEGMARVTYLAIRKRNPDITEERLRSLLFNPANLSMVNEAIAKANFPDTPENKGKKGGADKIKARRKALANQLKKQRE